jgi:hypothetical protein
MIEQQQEQLPPAIIIEKKRLGRDDLAPRSAGSGRGELDEVSHQVAMDELVYVCSLAPLYSRALTRSTVAAVTMSNKGIDPLTNPPCVVTVTRESPDVYLYELHGGTTSRLPRPLFARVRYNARHSRFEPTNPLGRTPSRPPPRQRDNAKAPTTATQAKKDEQDMADMLIIQEELSNKILGQAAPDGAVKREEAVVEATTTASSTRVPVDKLAAIGRAECSRLPTHVLIDLPNPRTRPWNGRVYGPRPADEPAKKAKTEHTESMMTEVPEPLKQEANQSLFDELVEYNKERRGRDQLHRMAEIMINAPVMQPSQAKTTEYNWKEPSTRGSLAKEYNWTRPCKDCERRGCGEKCTHAVPPPTWAVKSDCEMTRLTERLADMGFKNRSTEERYEREQARLERRYGDIVVAKEDARRSYEAQLAAHEKTIGELQRQNDTAWHCNPRAKKLEAARDELWNKCAMSNMELVGLRTFCKAQLEERDTEIAKLNRQLDTVSYTHPRVKQLEASRDELQKQRVLSDLEVVGLRELCQAQESELVTLREADEAQERELALLRERNAFLEQYKQDATELMTRLQQHIMSM